MSKNKYDSVWTESVTEAFKILWAHGWPIRPIGRYLGVSHNAVAGKRRRLGLLSRPGPFGDGKDHQFDSANLTIPEGMPIGPVPAGFLLHKLPKPPKEKRKRIYKPRPGRVYKKKAKSAVRPSLLPSEPTNQTVYVPRNERPARPGATCCWVMSAPGERMPRYCDVPCRVDGPYCDEHRVGAYAPPTKKIRIPSETHRSY